MYRVRSLGADCENDLLQERGWVLTKLGESTKSIGLCLYAEGQEVVM